MLSVCFPFFDLLADVFETGEHFDHSHIVLLADHVCHDRGYDALDGRTVGCQRAGFLLRCDDIVQKQYAQLVSGEHDELVSVSDDCAAAVAVRVGADDQVGVMLLGQIDGQTEGVDVVRIRGSDRREVSVDDHLLRNGDNVLRAQTLQDFRNQFVPGAVQRRVDQFEVRGFLNGGSAC